jgi:tetratricopeptide (TPR) repeat protein
VELFRRATILDPSFARAYLGLGQALQASGDKTIPGARSDAHLVGGRAPVQESADQGTRTHAVYAQAAKHFDRALELNPALGEAWMEQARLARDPVKAGGCIARGSSWRRTAHPDTYIMRNFLFRESRAGEAIGTITRASQIDPLTPELYETHAFFLMVTRSDVAGHDRLVREALAINPRLPSALRQLAQSRWEYSGEFADAAQLIERAIAVDPKWAPSRTLARDIYLDLGDRAAAVAALGDSLPLTRGWRSRSTTVIESGRQRCCGRSPGVLVRPQRLTGVDGGGDSRRRSRHGRVRTGREAPRVRVRPPGALSPDVEPRVFAGICAHAGACG